jgi:hypothetical protein
MKSSSSSEQRESSGGILKRRKSRKRDRQLTPPTDSDNEDPFHFDTVLSSSPAKKKDVSPSSTLSSSLFRRASIVPVDPNAAPASHRFSLLRERASQETIFVQEIRDADGRRWSLRVPASGLPEDMVHMLEELEKLAIELGEALPRIVVTCSAESLSLKRMNLDTTVKSSELLRPPPTVNEPPKDDASSSRRSLAKEKCRLVEPQQACEEPVGPAVTSPVAVSSPSEQSLTCIYLPEVISPALLRHPHLTPSRFCQFAPEFLSGSSTSPVLQPADGFHSKPAPAVQCPRQRAFFSALREPAKSSSTPISSGLAKRLAARSTEPPSAAKQKSRNQAKRSALPILRNNNSNSNNSKLMMIANAETWATDRTRTTLVSETKLPDPTVPLPPSLPPPPQSVGAHAHTALQPAAAASTSSQPNRSGTGMADADARRTVPAPASTQQPQSARRLKHLFRRPPVRSASDPPVYSVRQFTVKRPASEEVSAPREVVVERRMPRLPSARDLLRKLT